MKYKSHWLFLLIIIVIVFSSCLSVKQKVEIKTVEVIKNIRENDVESFKTKMNGRFDEDREGNAYWFNEAHVLIKKHFKENETIPFTVEYNSPSPMAEVNVPLFTGFDSSNGLRKATLTLMFTPKSSFSGNPILATFPVSEDFDANYRKYLLANKLIPSVSDSIIKPMDSTLESERKKIKVFE